MTKFLPKKTLLLAGAGHAHIGMLRRLSATRLKASETIDADIHLISEQPQTIYSGMLPGWMAGHYQLHDISIDIKSLCVRAGVRFIQQSLVQVNAASNKVVTTGDEQTDFDYDVLSLNTGADTDMRWLRDHKDQNDYRSDSNDRDANTDVIAIRPLSTFITQWRIYRRKTVDIACVILADSSSLHYLSNRPINYRLRQHRHAPSEPLSAPHIYRLVSPHHQPQTH